MLSDHTHTSQYYTHSDHSLDTTENRIQSMQSQKKSINSFSNTIHTCSSSSSSSLFFPFFSLLYCYNPLLVSTFRATFWVNFGPLNWLSVLTAWTCLMFYIKT